MSDERVTPKGEWIPPHVQALVDAGWGTVELQHDPDSDIVIGFHSLSLPDMERMGEEERIRLGVQADYLGLIAFINDSGSRQAD